MVANVLPKRPKSISSLELRRSIRTLNRLDLDRAGYDQIRARIGEMIQGVMFACFTMQIGTVLYRGRKSSKKLMDVEEIGSPNASLVTDYQRCNKPNDPMFYGAVHPATAVYELNPDIGESVYLSNWTTTEEFLAQTIPPDELGKIENDPIRDQIATFFETKFAQPIHETFSSQYKITSAISDVLTSGSIKGELDDHLRKNKVGAIKYPSVAMSEYAECLALRPWLERNCLKLNYVEEVLITDVGDGTISFDRKDVSSTFANGKIHWAGKPLHWTLDRAGSFQATVERGGWVVRHEDGTIVHPG